jgi:hypothetical protein
MALSKAIVEAICFSALDSKIHILVTSQPANVSRAKRFKVEQRHPCQHTHQNSQRRRKNMEHSQLQRRLQSHRALGSPKNEPLSP